MLGDFFQNFMAFSEYLNFTYVLCCSLNAIQTTVLWFVRKCLSKVSFKLLEVEMTQTISFFKCLFSSVLKIILPKYRMKILLWSFQSMKTISLSFEMVPSQNNLRFQWLFHFILHLFIPFILTMKILEVVLIQQFSKHTVKAKQKKYPIKNI